MLRRAKKRFVHSNAPNWIDTQMPMPNRGVRVPYHARIPRQTQAHVVGCMRGTHLVESERTLVLQDTPSTVQHAAVGALRRRLHALCAARGVSY